MEKKLYHFILILSIVSLGFNETLAQVPQSFLYQAEARDSRGKLLVEELLSVQVSILQNNTVEVYKETHTVQTDLNGLFNLRVGEGDMMELGDFSLIEWNKESYFLKIQIAVGNGTNYSNMGSTQLLSVPYALHAKTAEYIMNDKLALPVYTSAEIDELGAVAGDAVFNSTEDLFLIYNGDKWLPFTPNANCWPIPTIAKAGIDQIITDNKTTVTLSANTPEAGYGSGEWSIVSGGSGSFADATSPTTTFTGSECTRYNLKWSISTNCGVSYDLVIINFNHTPSGAYAGRDIVVYDGTNTATLDANTPQVGQGTGQWSIVSGLGGNITDPSSPTSTFTGTEGAYVLRWKISTACSYTYDDVHISFSSPITDSEGNSYNTVWIGTQLWMAENLRTKTFSDGTAIPLVTDNTEWSNLSTPGYCWYDNDEATYGADYGVLYNHYTVGTNKLCPDGWRVPYYPRYQNYDWTELRSVIGGTYGGGNLKETGTTHWQSPNTYASNLTGFTALPGGRRNPDGTFSLVGKSGYWWSNSYVNGNPMYINLSYNNGYFYVPNTSRESGFSVRCVKY